METGSKEEDSHRSRRNLVTRENELGRRNDHVASSLYIERSLAGGNTEA